MGPKRTKEQNLGRAAETAAGESKPNGKNGEIVELDEAIRMMKTSRTTIYRWIREGRIRAMKAGRQWRFRREDIDRFLSGESPRPALPISAEPLIAALLKLVKGAGGKAQTDTAAGPDPIQKALPLILQLGILMRASDIHIAPQGDVNETKGIIRVRVDGVLQTVAEMDARLLPHLIDRIKTAAGCDVLETAKPQDGRIKMEIGGEPYDFRLCFVPLGRGPSVTMRILSSRHGLIDLDRIGFAPSDRERIDKALSAPHGFILFTGPTGSGKSTCCYSALAKIAGPEIKVMSIEDPIEATIPWVDQVQVNASVGLTFARALRSVLRSDLDAVLVGEIRDLETLQLIIQTALTGHLVLSTLHTNRAPEALTRMMDIGAEPFLISNTVRLIVAQRLIRLLCSDCAESYKPTGGDLRRARQALLESNLNEDDLPHEFKRPKGCIRCNQTGYRGRDIIAETLVMTPDLARALEARQSTEDLTRLAIAGGMSTLAADAARKAFGGRTSLEEAYRIASPF